MKRKFNAINVEINMPTRTMNRFKAIKRARIDPIQELITYDPIDKIDLDEIDLSEMVKLSKILDDKIQKYMHIKSMIDETRFMYC